MAGPATLAGAIERGLDAIGRVTAALATVMVVLQFAIVLFRHVLGVNALLMQDSVLYLHAALFLFGAGYVAARNGHVRVDILQNRFSVQGAAWVELLGTFLLLLPFCAAVLIFSLPYAAQSWATLEASREATGLPLLFVLKSLVPVFALMLAADGLARILRACLVLSADGPPPDRS
jgi:TRAP-type mannitol/chloroaromatic compound transport system permease small subunit